MKKLLLILVGFVLAIGVMSVAGFAYAQTQDPPDPDSQFPCPFCDGTGEGYVRRSPGMRGGRGGYGGSASFDPGLMGWTGDGEYGPMHDAMSAALADAYGLTVEELQALHDEGTTLWQYAEEQGMTEEEFQTAMFDARSVAIEQAVADGTLTQEQADFMLEHMQQMQENGFGPCQGGVPGGGHGGAHGGRWSAQP